MHNGNSYLERLHMTASKLEFATDISAELAWSRLDPRPTLIFLLHHDEYMCVWNGVIMPMLHAQCLAAEYLGIYQSPSVKEALDQHYHKLYYAGAFGSRAWDEQVKNRNTYMLLKDIMANHLNTHLKDKSGPEIMSWFDPENARVKVKVSK